MRSVWRRPMLICSALLCSAHRSLARSSFSPLFASRHALPPPSLSRLVISDGEHYIQAMLATQLNHLVAPAGPLQASSILKLHEYICNEISSRKVIIMLNIQVLQEKADNIGNPTNIMV